MPRPSGAGGRRARPGRSPDAPVGPHLPVQRVRGGAFQRAAAAIPPAGYPPVILVADVVDIAPRQAQRLQRAVLVHVEHAAALLLGVLAAAIMIHGSPPGAIKGPVRRSRAWPVPLFVTRHAQAREPCQAIARLTLCSLGMLWLVRLCS